MPSYVFDSTAPSAAAVRQLVEFTEPAAAAATLNVSADDDMLAFSAVVTGFGPLAAMAYFRAGLSIINTVKAVAAWRFGSIERVGSFLDFACGYGRSTRFLAKLMPPSGILACEIQSDALAYQASEFGVQTLRSTTAPDDLPVTRTFDIVFAASLFTHLPHKTFAAWLRKLWEFVAPGGILVFSVHDEAINDTDAELDETGFVFIASTEVAALSVNDYGANFTTETYVRRQLETALGSEATHARRLPRALCHKQDVWVVPKTNPLDGELTYECGPVGHVDELAISGRKLMLRGWAADEGFSTLNMTSHRISSVDVYLRGVLVGGSKLGLPRPDVAAHLRNRTMRRYSRRAGRRVSTVPRRAYGRMTSS